MNIIASLTRSQPQLAESVVQDLSDLFRASLGEAHRRVPLSTELELSRKYLQIEKLRMGKRLDVAWEINALPGDALIPLLTIQPLVENAVYHGIEHLPAGGTIRITGQCNKDIIEITIINPVSNNQSSSSPTGNRMALQNIQQRLEAYYSGQGKLTIETGSASEPHFTARLSFPYQQEFHEDIDR
jgi:two-component system sensor histidine kinase AlgZ